MMRACLVAQQKNTLAVQNTQEMWVQFLGWEDPVEEGMATHSSILAWNPHGQEPGDTVHGVTKSQHD